MVKKRQTKRQRDIKTKLMAAICMLLVSSIMMVSTTYAWFTLSTAPEVTGISTAVGANGNLEMALLPSPDAENADMAIADLLKTITTQSGDSTKPVNERNITWGNLVDVSNNDYYGMNNITLYPSQLRQDAQKDADGNITKLPDGALLETPQYGADGRISEMSRNTQVGSYVAMEGIKDFYPDADVPTYGVRAVGTASGLSARELSYRNARAAANDARGLAQNKAAQSLSGSGNALAAIAVKLAAGSDATYTQDDVDAMGKIISDLTAAGGVLDQIEISYMQYLLAFAASNATGTNDEAWNTIKAEVEKEGATLSGVLSKIEDLAGEDALPESLTAGIAAYQDTVAAVGEASDLYDELLAKGKDSYVWGDLSPILEKLADPEEMLINGMTVDQVKADKQPLVNDVLGGKGITVTITTGGGVYADVADQCGNYTANIRIENVLLMGININTNATMNAEIDKEQLAAAYIPTLGRVVDGLGAPSVTSEAKPMTDIFGYVIDLAFRTNAADSNLLLQTEAVDRIYGSLTGAEIKNDDGTIDTTMGHGASMTFQSTNPTFDNDAVKNLMESIRIVFFNPATREVYATAKLDVAKATEGADGVTAKMYLYKLTQGGEVTYKEVEYDTENNKGDDYYYTKTEAVYEVGNPDEGDGITYYTLTDGKYVVATDTTGAGPFYKMTAPESYNLVTDAVASTYGGTLYIKEVTAAGEQKIEDNAIMRLVQNTPAALSVLVYLDGNDVTNADVAATGNTSMKGTMSLQFASSAELTPMEYTPLMPVEAEEPEEPEQS